MKKFNLSLNYDDESEILTLFKNSKEEKIQLEFEDVKLTRLDKKIFVIVYSMDEVDFENILNKYNISLEEFNQTLIDYLATNDVCKNLDDILYDEEGYDLPDFLIKQFLSLDKIIDYNQWKVNNSTNISINKDYYADMIEYPDVDEILRYLRENNKKLWSLLNSYDRENLETAILDLIKEIIMSFFDGDDDLDTLKENLIILRPTINYDIAEYEYGLNFDFLYQKLNKDIKKVIKKLPLSVKIINNLSSELCDIFEGIMYNYVDALKKDLDWLSEYYISKCYIDVETIIYFLSYLDTATLSKKEKKGR